MRHQLSGHKLNRTTSHRRALLRNMATALFQQERIQTTKAKARALRPFAERLITLGKRGDLHARRLAARDIQDHEVLQKLFDDIAGRCKAREGGYTRILKLGTRRGDCSEIALIELVDRTTTSATPDAE
jgi:large subunit ribosomal protein L17